MNLTVGKNGYELEILYQQAEAYKEVISDIKVEVRRNVQKEPIEAEKTPPIYGTPEAMLIAR